MPEAGCRVLLIGNSRWHWAEASASGAIAAAPGGAAGIDWRCWDGPGADRAGWPPTAIRAWAAVGPVPDDAAALLPAERRLHTAQVPLLGAPAWLGVDRALVAWQAWCRQQRLEPAPVLVADAGTVLSLTLVGRQGRFLGGRLLAGAALQWRAMAAGTAGLPALALAAGDAMAADPAAAEAPAALWPQATAAAMEVGVIEGLAAAVDQALAQLRRLGSSPEAAASADWRGMEDLRLWICGGDGPRLAPRLKRAGLPLVEAPHLAVEALIRLSEANGGLNCTVGP